MPPKKRTGTEAFNSVSEVHTDLLQLSSLSGRVSRYFGVDRRDARILDPNHATSLADELDGVAKMFREHAEACTEDGEKRLTLCSLPDDIIALIYDALGEDKASKCAFRATCRTCFETLAELRPFRFLRYPKNRSTRVFMKFMSRLSYVSKIRTLSISWEAARRIHHEIGFERFISLEKILLDSVRKLTTPIKQIDNYELTGEKALPPIGVHFCGKYKVNLSVVWLQRLFRRRICSVTGDISADFLLDYHLPLETLNLTGCPLEWVFIAAHTVTKCVEYYYVPGTRKANIFFSAAPMPDIDIFSPIAPPQRAAKDRPILKMSRWDTCHFTHEKLLQYYSAVEFPYDTSESDVAYLALWMTGEDIWSTPDW